MKTENVVTGMMSALLACTGGAILIVQSSHHLGLDRTELVSWMFAVYVIGGLLNFLLSLRYRIPFGGAHSITVAAFLSTAAVQFPWPELAGSFIMAGVLLALLGVTGLFGKVLEYIPKPLMDAMLAGLILSYAVALIPSMKEAPIVGGMAVLGFFLAPRVSRAIPPIFGVVVFAVLGLVVSNELPKLPPAEFVVPQLVMPSFTVRGFLSVTIPCAVLVLSNDVAVALTALKKNGFDAPVNRTLLITGLTSAFAGFFGGHATNIGGMMSALCSSEEAGPKEKRYKAAMVSGLLVALFGLFAWKLGVVIQALPMSFIRIITGFSLVGVLLGSLQSSFSDASYRYSVLFSFIVAISNVSFLGVSAAVWSLVAGAAAAKLLGEGKAKEKERVPTQ
jgi:benzoate membrane transport protein